MTQQSKFYEKTMHTEKVFQGKMISLQVDTVSLPDGKTATREIVKHPGAVAIIAIVNDKLVMVEQFRKPMDKCLIEIPAGKLETDEDPTQAAYRELEEETGYRAGSLKPLVSFYTSPGFADELLHIYVADQLHKSEMHPDEDEFIECLMVSLAEAKEMIVTGQIADVKTIMAIYVWELKNFKGKMEL